MKKIFTLLFAIGSFAFVQAQPGNRDNQRNDQRNNDQRDNNGYDKDKTVVIEQNGPFDNNGYDRNGRFDDKFASIERKRDMEIAQINREFDQKVLKVKKSFFMTRFAKDRQIRSLEQQRQREISAVYAKYMYMKKNGNGRDRHDNRRY